MGAAKVILKATFVNKTGTLFYYRIEGDANWKEVFSRQKHQYISYDSSNNLICSLRWYYGRKCDVCVNDYSGKVFFYLGDDLILFDSSPEFWRAFAKETGDANWLTRIPEN